MVSKFLTDLPVKGSPKNNDIVLIQDIDASSTSVVSLSNLRDYMFSSTIPNLSTTNFTATTATFTIIDIKQYELSGFDVTGSVIIRTGPSGDFPVGPAALNLVTPARAMNIFDTLPNPNAPAFYYYKTRGNSISEHVVLSGGDNIVVHAANASNGEQYIEVGRMQISMDSTATDVPSVSSLPSRISFNTTSQSTTAAQIRMTINHLGNVGIGTTNPSQTLTVVGNISATGSVYSNSTLNRYATNIGDNSADVFTVTHNLGTRDVITSVYDNSTYENIITSIANTTLNTVSLSFNNVPATNAYRVVVIG